MEGPQLTTGTRDRSILDDEVKCCIFCGYQASSVARLRLSIMLIGLQEMPF